MGTWDVGPFDNDTAADWCGGLDDAAPEARGAMVRAALAETAGTTDYLDSDVANEAIAAAALVAAQCPGGAPGDSAYGPDEPLPDLTGLRELALRALDRVLTEPSEALELWEEAEDGPWHTGINQLRGTLMPRP